MKKPVLQRAMFVAMAPKQESKGIISGFDEEMENEDYEDRTPENLEIIANNLRGDIRSMDERYLELAQLVGEAAFETPEEVVALMQSQMAAQQPMPPAPAPQSGIAALGVPPAAPQASGGIMAGMEESQSQMQAPGTPENPIGMARGGDPAAILRAAQNIPSFGQIPGLPIAQLGPQGAGANAASMEALQYLASRGSPYMAQRLNDANVLTRAGQNVFGSLLNAGPAARELGRTIMSTPQGRAAGALAAVGAPAMMYFGNQMGGESASGEIGSLGQPASSPEMEAAIRSIPTGAPQPAPPAPPAPPTAEEMAVRNIGWQDLTPRLGAAQEAIEAATPRADEETGMPVERGEIKFPTVAKAPERTFRDRVKEKMDIYSEFLGGDPEMRKAQALFLLAEAALNVAGAKGRNIPERLVAGFKGLPAGMAAIGAEAEKERRAITAAALQSVESEIAAEKKDATTIAREIIRLQNKKPGKAEQIAGVLRARQPGLTDAEALQLGTEIDTGLVTFDEKTGEAIDKVSGTVRFSPYKPLGPSSVGYIDPKNPFARMSADTIAPASLDERKNLLNRRADLQRSIAQNERMLSDIYGDTIGFLPTIQSGVSRLVLATFGDTGFGLTDVEKNQIRQNLAVNREAILKSNLRNAGRPSVYDQKKIEGLVEDPNKLFASPELIVSSVSNFVREDINELARIDAQLFGTPVRELGRIPTGARSDPIPMRANIGPVLNDIFTKRPNAVVWTTRPDGRTARITAQEFFAQQGPAQ